MDQPSFHFGAGYGAILGAILVVWLIVRARRTSATLPVGSIDPGAPVAGGVSRIEIVTSHPSLAYFYKAVQPNVRLDGTLHGAPWGTSFFAVAPGTHTVAISYPWLVQEAGRAVVTVTVRAGETRRVRYQARMIRFVPGKISVDASVPEAPAPGESVGRS